MCSALGDVRFVPESGHVQCNSVCPLSANSGTHAPLHKTSSLIASRLIALGISRVLIISRLSVGSLVGRFCSPFELGDGAVGQCRVAVQVVRVQD